MTLDKEDLDDRQRHLLDVLTREFEEALLLGTASGTALYQRLRQQLGNRGRFEFRTGQLRSQPTRH
jgi:hypothetical protein